MNERIKKLRQQSRSAIPYLSLERALLITDFYKTGAAQLYSIPVSRARAFQYILENKEICINDGELIVGERGPEPKATPSYPEVCCHSLKDLEILNSREKISFKVQDDVWQKSKDIVIPFWKGKTIREKIFSQVDQEWINAYSAGIFTEFMEQRAPGHTVAGKNIWNTGFLDFKETIQKTIENLDFFNDPDAFAKREQLEAMNIAADSIISYAKRYSEEVLNLVETVSDPNRKKELERIAEICSRIPAHAPRTFWEALQHYWFIHLGVITEYNTWDAFNPGRLDQHLYPFYLKDVSDGILTKEDAIELLQAFWIKFNNQPAPPKVGVTAEESGTYTDFCNINLGGLKDDGTDGVNELSYILLDVIEDMRILQPSSNIQVSEKTPDDFIKRALKIVKTGFGQPSVFNADAIVKELTRQGKSLVDARNGGASGCVETGAFGKEAYILTGYFNLVKILEITLHNGNDPLTNIQFGLKTGDPTSFKSFHELLEAYTKQIKHFVDIKIKGNLIIERIWAQNPSPFLSIIIDDCIVNGKDYNDGGAKYNTSYIQIVGMGSITDCLTSLKYNVYDNNIYTMEQLLEVLKNDFEGFEEIRQKLISRTPKYGNDKDYADNITQQVFEIVYNAIDGRPNTRGGVHRINLLPTTVHIYFGKVTGATPDGRKAFTPLSEGISPVQGMDINGPTSVIKSAGKIDHLRTGGSLLNQKFSPQFFSSESGTNNVAHLIRSYFKMGGHHIQFNVVSAKTLRAAQEDPIQYCNLIVRVAGYSDYYINLGKDLQDEIIKRTEHLSV
ncbi:MAG: glycyl radical protein [Candidatus Lokiarchaeota archaeon]|nr:glycyl radical protein [Candidatus Lokiarchaeota archaeon]